MTRPEAAQAAAGFLGSLVLEAEAHLPGLDLSVQDLAVQVGGGRVLDKDPAALFLDDAVGVGRSLDDRQLEGRLRVAYRPGRDLEATFRHR